MLRRAELAVVWMVSKRKPPVIATGGGRAKSRNTGLDKDNGAPDNEVPDVRKHDAGAGPAEAKVSVAPISGKPKLVTKPAATVAEPAKPVTKPAGATVLAFPDGKARKQKRSGSGSRWRLWAILGIVAAAVVLLMLVVLFSPLLALKTITVDGTKLASPEQIQTALASLKGKPLPQINQAQVEQLLTGMVQVQSVDIEARPPGTLLVHVTERLPVAVLKNGEQYVLVDPQGAQLGTVADPAAAKLPLIDGGTAAIGQQTFASITAVLAALPDEVRAQMQSASASSPNAVELTLLDGKKVVWGDSSQMALKAKVLQALLNTPPAAVPGKPAPPAITTYDVSSPTFPVTR